MQSRVPEQGVEVFELVKCALMFECKLFWDLCSECEISDFWKVFFFFVFMGLSLRYLVFRV